MTVKTANLTQKSLDTCVLDLECGDWVNFEGRGSLIESRLPLGSDRAGYILRDSKFCA
jgi:hypothetical protein